MPHINRVRVNNVKYNFGTQYYDDFLMRFSGKNTIYDLANGGGKSVLMLLLMQNMIPNCTLDEKQPIEKLFRTGSGSTTIHSLVEWKLSDAHIKENYRYMLTGFCARKAKDSENTDVDKDTASIEYFNYVIFYREFNDNDIKNLPLKNGNERVTYSGLKNYLRDLEKKDLSLKIHIFERKGEYQRFISQYGIYESEWEIVRGINKTEGHVRTYFESNYKTTRKVVEDLLIQEIIQKSFNNKTYSDGQEDIMAKTLIGIKDKLLELLKSREDIQNFDRQIEVIESFANRVQSVKELYFGKENLTDEIIRCFYTIKNIIAKCEEDRQKALKEIGELEGIQNTYKKEIDTALVEKEIQLADEISEQLEVLEQKLIQEKEKASKREEELLIKESINDYSDYLYYKKERDGLTVLVDNILKDKGSLIGEIQELAAVKARRDEIKKAELIAEIEKEQKIIDMEHHLIEELRNEDIALEKEMAVLEYLINAKQKEVNEISEKLNKKRGEYTKVLSFDLHAEKKTALEEKNSTAKRLVDIETEMNNISKTKEELETVVDRLKLQKVEYDEKLSVVIDKRSEVSRLRERAEKLCQVYGERDVFRMRDALNARYIEAANELNAHKAILKKLEAHYEGLNNGSPVPLSQEVLSVYDYIVRYHGDIAILGADLIKELPMEKRKEVIDTNPLIPYAVVIKSDYHTIMSDMKLKELNASGYVVPILRYEAVQNGEFTIDSSNLSFVMCNEELFYNEELLERQQLKSKEEMSSVQFKIEQLSETCELLKKDSYFAEEYVSVYMQQCEEIEREYESLKSLRKEVEKKDESAREQLQEIESNLVFVANHYNEAKDSVIKAETDYEIIEALVAFMEAQNKAGREVDELQTKYKNTKSKYETQKARLEAQECQLVERENHVSSMKDVLEEIKTNWDQVYKNYYREGIEVESALTDAEVETRFRGLKQALESTTTDVTDKQKLISNYDLAMEKALNAIDYNGVFLEDIKKLFEEAKAKEVSSEELKAIKSSISDIKKKINEMTVEVSKLKTSKDRMDGSIEKGKSEIVLKYGEYVPIRVENSDYDGYVQSKLGEIDKYKEKLTLLNSDIKSMDKSQQKYAMFERDIDKIIASTKINVGNEEKTLGEVVDIEEKISQIVEKNDKFLKSMYDKREEFEKEKQMLVDILFKMGAEPLSEEMKNNIIMPEAISEADMLEKALYEIVDCIELEKNRIEKSIEDMERIKENFENQCIQTCVNIKTELDRLPKLSKIFMDNETISIISLNIPYVKEEQYKLRMEQYINETVETADTMRNEAERLKFIKNQLSFKKLFSVIVSDMNAIKLNLYKRERIKEQSRYLKYEEAVGSTGQSQGIYIQFLIAIINYISSINSRNSEGSGLKKTIFIDNPFGAAKDIYIWEPIFKLLKTNNVQLIVPARGTTPAITGRFDVNYILGQKLVDGKQQTVVVDYCSNVDNEKMDYHTLTYEQTALF